MRNGFRLFVAAALGMAACAWTARAGEGDRVTFETLDGVTLEGTFFKADPQNGAKDKSATVLLLHNIDKAKGGSSHQDGWDDLAKKLSAEGYSVLSFDFRGFGKSHEVSKDFWDPFKGRHNCLAMPTLARQKPPPTTIDHKDFDGHSSEYYPWLVNDIVAAKSFLDRKTDQGQANSSNLVLVGAGEGATLGAMWMASQWDLKRFGGIDQKTGKLLLDEPEGRDEAGALWLTISPELGSRGMSGTSRRWLCDIAADNNVPMAFLFGAKDDSGGTIAKEAMDRIANQIRRDNPNMKDEALKAKIGAIAISRGVGGDSKLTGSQLLGLDGIQDDIVKGVGELIDKRGPREARSHTVRIEDQYYWTFPNMVRPLPAKTNLDQNIQLMPADKFIMATSGE
ncbi:MAG TPA: hypothetical protein VMS17_03005 [Gemmataceae bacterium]|nr:hypothetical protein [Gemmataceae bacterium]